MLKSVTVWAGVAWPVNPSPKLSDLTENAVAAPGTPLAVDGVTVFEAEEGGPLYVVELSL